MKKRSKGFTLVELLAVIVVLAIIMVIATQSISSVISRSAANSFKSSLDMAVKNAKNLYAQGTTVDTANVVDATDFDKTQYAIFVKGDLVCLQTLQGGKFENLRSNHLEDAFGKTDSEMNFVKMTDTNKTTYQANLNDTRVCANYKANTTTYSQSSAIPTDKINANN